MDFNTITRAKSRLGFHYFNDSLHYRESDLQKWLPEISACGASWLTLIAPHDRAIPEEFIHSLIREHIEPVLHFKLPLPHLPDMENLRLLFNVYSQWDVQYAVLFDRPNHRQSWSGSSWAQNDLVERFLDIFLPVADLAVESGLTPVFPPLEPGGDYWDTAFLRAALAGIKRRGHAQLVDLLVLGAYGWLNSHHLGWGVGGPERWPKAKPYRTPVGQENQLGFYISDWYLAIAEAELGKRPPIIYVAAGFPPATGKSRQQFTLDLARHTEMHAAIARLMSGQPVEDPEKGELLIPPAAHVLACNFWLLAADAGTPEEGLAWFRTHDSGTVENNLPAVTALRQFQHNPGSRTVLPIHQNIPFSNRPVAHYLLLPESLLEQYDQLPDDLWWFIQHNHPTLGFSLEEAALAARVTVVDGQDQFPESSLESLRVAGASVEYLKRDGTSIAPQLATHETE